MQIPFLDLARQQQELDAEIKAAVVHVLEHGHYILGAEVAQFEDEWARVCGARAAAGVANGTDALTLALIASGAVRAGHNDEVITTPLTAGYTALAIRNAGGVPVFADLDPQRFTLAPAAIESAITAKTRAIVPVHLYGQLAAMEAINNIAQQHNLIVIEDAAQAHGASVGSFSRAATFSFKPTKNLGAWGDGGAVVSNDEALIARVKTLRQGGHWNALQSETAGRNSRLDELQAAILRVKLRHLQRWTERRRHLAAKYWAALQMTSLLLPLLTDEHVFHLFVVCHAERDSLRVQLQARGIETLIHYPYLLHQQPLFRRAEQAALPVAEQIVTEIFSLPLYPQLSDEEVNRVIALLQKVT
jgi:dTDP-4-amino-4,6-dideoxygalactose transaminase